jgi:hypothetical protein
MVLSSAEGVPSDEMSPFSGFAPEFLEALLLTSSSWLSSFGLFLVTILRSRTSFISCCSYCAFFNFSLSALKTCSSTIRFLIVSNTSMWVSFHHCSVSDLQEHIQTSEMWKKGRWVPHFRILGFRISWFQIPNHHTQQLPNSERRKDVGPPLRDFGVSNTKAQYTKNF